MPTPLARLSTAARLAVLGACAALLQAGCTNTRIDEQRIDATTVVKGDAAVVLGRRHNGDYETEPDFVSCIGRGVGSAGVPVVAEPEFMNALYPWFEPRTAPMNLDSLQSLMRQPLVADRLEKMHIRYIVWVDGSTATTDKKGTMSCAIGPGGAGCLGFGMWEKQSSYEARVWDVKSMQPIASVSAKADGTSYMPAVIVPIPIIARVQGAACDGLATQLHKLFAAP